LKKFYLIDGTGLVYRAFFAIRNLNTSRGEPVNALYGLARMLTKLLRERIEADDKIAFILDKGRETFRTQMYNDYKAQRPDMPEDLKFQMQFLSDFVNAFGIKVLSIENYEADDIIATFTEAFKDGIDLFEVVTSDKDLFQLINDKVRVLRAERGVTRLREYDRETFEEKYGFPPKKMLDYLSLVGDKSDNVPGVKGIGKKRATDMIQTYQTLEKIYDNLDNLTKANRKRLEESREEAFLSKRLITLKYDVELPDTYNDPGNYAYAGIKREDLYGFFRKFQFDSLIDEWEAERNREANNNGTQNLLFQASETQGTDAQENEETVDYLTVLSDAETGEKDGISLDDLLERLKSVETLAFDVETTSLNVRYAELVGISLSWKAGEAYYLPVGHKNAQNNAPESVTRLLERLENKQVIGHNLKYDFAVLLNNGYTIPANYYDTMLASYLINPDKGRHGLDLLVKEEFGHKMMKFSEVMEKHQKGGDFSSVSVEEATHYSGEDADFTLRLYSILSERVKEKKLETLLHDIELPLIPVLIDLENRGVYFNKVYLEELSGKTGKKIDTIKEKIYTMAGEPFNLNSPIQIGEIFFDKLGLPSQGRTSKSKNYKTGKEVLEKLAEDYEIAQLLLEYRKYAKLKSTYIDALPEYIDKRTGRIHSNFNQIGTTTGRLSSSEPNLQNLPIKEEEGREIRHAITPQKDGWSIVSADYSQIELRLMAHISRDNNLIHAFEEGLDVHSFTASKLFSVDMADVDKPMRSTGKMINFSLIYGISPYGLARRLNISADRARQFIDNYFQAYPCVKKYMDNIVKVARDTKAVRTVFNRLRPVRYIDARNNRLKQEANRIAINSPVQGTAADIMKLAMIKVREKLLENSFEGFMMMQIHDEIVLEVPDSEIEAIKKVVKEEMESVCELSVPLTVDIDVGKQY